jgi:hypothetical protein
LQKDSIIVLEKKLTPGQAWPKRRISFVAKIKRGSMIRHTIFRADVRRAMRVGHAILTQARYS